MPENIEINYLEEIRTHCAERMKALSFVGKPEYENLLKKELKDLVDWPAYGNVNMSKRLCELKAAATTPAPTNKSGSIILYLLGISAVDPVIASLPQDTVALAIGDCPDIDTDFDPRYRKWVKALIVKLFTEEKTCSIGSYQTYKTRAVIVDVSRALGLDVWLAMEVTKKMNPLMKFETDDGEEEKIDQMDWEEIFQFYPELKAYLDENPEVFRHCKVLRNQVKNMSKHAGGMIISNLNLQDKIPVIRDKDGLIVASWTEGLSDHELSEVGLVKFDILGLSNLSVIDECVKIVKKTRGITLTKSQIPINDHDAIRFGCKKDLVGIFQFESPATKPIADSVVIDSIFDISAVTSLLRPGPKDMGMHIAYAERKHGREAYVIPECLKDVLGETYGVITYQEQCMKIAQKLCGFDPVESNKLRSVISKKKKDQLPKMKEKFLKGAKPKVESGEITQKEVEDMWDQLESFGSYGFNLSHSISYSAVTAVELWLKFNFPEEYMTAILNNTKLNEKKNGCDNMLVSYVNYCRSNGIKVLNPNINQSETCFNIPLPRNIRYGLDHIKMVGKCAIEIASLRPFTCFEDFAFRVNKRKINKRVVSNLIFAGAFDEFGRQICLANKEKPEAELTIADYRNAIELAYHNYRNPPKRVDPNKKVRANAKPKKPIIPPPVRDLDEYWELEKSVLGLSLSKPVLMRVYKDLVESKQWTSIEDAGTKDDCYLFGRVDKIIAKKSKSGKDMRCAYLSDDINELMFFVFKDDIRQFQNLVKIGSVVAIYTSHFKDGKQRYYNSRKNVVIVEKGKPPKPMPEPEVVEEESIIEEGVVL